MRHMSPHYPTLPFTHLDPGLADGDVVHPLAARLILGEVDDVGRQGSADVAVRGGWIVLEAHLWVYKRMSVAASKGCAHAHTAMLGARLVPAAACSAHVIG